MTPSKSPDAGSFSGDQHEKDNVDDCDRATLSALNDQFLAELEENMRQEFFTPSLSPPSSSSLGYSECQSKPRYVHQSLAPGDDIRLFHLERGSRNDPVKGRIIHVSMASKPDYEALSYAWGDPVKLGELYTVEGVIPITASLTSALARIRYPDRTRVLWVDSLCINQGDNEEKSQQILLMGKIYSAASKVVIYLGCEADRSDLAIEIIEKIAEQNFEPFPATVKDRTSLPILDLSSNADKAWKAFRSFWRRPWFRRVWVLQEFILARDLVIICGEWEKDWKIFLGATEKINDWGLTLRSNKRRDEPWLEATEFFEANSGTTAMMQMCALRVSSDWLLSLQNNLQQFDKLPQDLPMTVLKMATSMMAQTPGMSNSIYDQYDISNIPCVDWNPRIFKGESLMNLIHMTDSREATDARDRLFALISLANDLDDEELHLCRPNYDKPVEWVVCRYASVLVRKGQCMQFLYRASLGSGRSKLPSWIPDWTSSSLLQSLNRYSIGVLGKGVYLAAGNSVSGARIGEQHNILVATGDLVDTIERVSISTILDMVSNRSLIALNEADSIVRDLSFYPSGESLFQVQWRTLIGNLKARDPGEAPEEYGIQYKAWREHIRLASLNSTPEHGDLHTVEANPYIDSLLGVGRHRLCRTRRGYIGLAPLSTRLGDQISVLNGSIVPFVLRQSIECPGMFRLVGGCYIHGIMKGEALKFSHWREHDLYLH